MGYGCWLEAVEFVEVVVEAGVCYEVVYVFFFAVVGSLGFIGEGAGACEGVVD